MNPSWFDEFTKLLARSPSRREVLKGVAASVMGSVLSYVGIENALAWTCTGGLPGQPCAASKPFCCNDSVCTGGTCVCLSGLTQCGSACVNLNTNAHNCGMCGHACQHGQTCVGGVCTGCPTGQTLCNGTCINLNSDAHNCGSCGNVCASGETCVKGGGSCGSAGDCPGDQNCCSGMCVNEATDPNNCGGCGIVCASGQTCQGGMCMTSCSPNGAACIAGSECCSGCCSSGTCADTQSDFFNCGTCGNTCLAGEVCINGSCSCDGSGACSSGQVCCASPIGCVNVQNDPNNCGSCGNVCPAFLNGTVICTNGVCGGICNQGFADCDGNPANGCEVHTQTDRNNCGACGIVCSCGGTGAPICKNGSCTCGP